MKHLELLALDLGASNGRGVLGSFDGTRITMKEMNRFDNVYSTLHGTLYWDVLHLFENCKRAFAACSGAGVQLHSFGIDTWGVDYGLLDKNGALLGNVRSYRNSADEDMEAVWEKISQKELFDRTGIAHLCFNTIYQLYKQKQMGDASLAHAQTLLFMPDLLAYFFTGEMGTEYTFATTSMLYNPIKREWAYDLIQKLGLPEHIFTPVQPSGTQRGRVLSAVAQELGISQIPFSAVGEHDTASAVAAIPGKGEFAFCSSGTWSLFGVETDEAVFSDTVYRYKFSNEGTVQGGFRPLKNIMGLWLIQECRRDWHKAGLYYSWDDIVQAASAASPLRSIIDPDSPEFFAAGNMEKKIQAYCANTQQPVPQTVGEIARCIYESLALKYRWALERLEEIRGRRLSALNIVGGGIQNKLLNQFAADSMDRPVITGPVEGAAMGNLLMQAVALNELSGIADVREVVRRSVDMEEYMPKHTQAWDDAYEKLLRYIKD